MVPRFRSLKNQSLQSKRSYYLRSLQSTEPLKKFVHFSTDFLQFKSIDHFIQQLHFNRFWKETTIWTLTKHPPIYLSFNGDIYKKKGQWTLISPITRWCPTGGVGCTIQKVLGVCISDLHPLVNCPSFRPLCAPYSLLPQDLCTCCSRYPEHSSFLCSSDQSYLPFRSQFKGYFVRETFPDP